MLIRSKSQQLDQKCCNHKNTYNATDRDIFIPITVSKSNVVNQL